MSLTFDRREKLLDAATAAGDSAAIYIPSGHSTVVFEVLSPAGTIALTPQVALRQGVYHAVKAVKLSDGSQVSSVTAAGVYAVSVEGMAAFRMALVTADVANPTTVYAATSDDGSLVSSGSATSSTDGLKATDLNIDGNRHLRVAVMSIPERSGGDDLNVAAAADRSNWLEVFTCREIAIMCPLVLPEVATLEVANTYVKPDGAGGFVAANLSDPADDQHVWREFRDESGAAVNLVPGTLRVVSQLGGIYAVRIKLDSVAAANRYFYVTHQD